MANNISRRVHRHTFSQRQIRFRFGTTKMGHNFGFPLVTAFNDGGLARCYIRVHRFRQRLLSNTRMISGLLGSNVTLLSVFVSQFYRMTVLLTRRLNHRTGAHRQHTRVVTCPHRRRHTIVHRLLGADHRVIGNTNGQACLKHTVFARQQQGGPFASLRDDVFRVSRQSILSAGGRPHPTCHR